MKTSYDNNYIKNTPDFVYSPAQPLELAPQKNAYEVYINKFKTAVYGAVIFSVLSLPAAYKILDIIGKLFSNNVELVDEECGEPLLLARAIMAAIVGVLLFIL